MQKKLIEKEQSSILQRYKMDDCNLHQIIEITYKSGEFLCLEGQDMKYLLVLLSGKAKVSITTSEGRTLLLCFYVDGGIMGDVELMMDTLEIRSNIQAVTPVRCIGIPMDKNRELLKKDLTFMSYVAGSLARKLDRCSKNSAFTILHTVETRLCSYIALACVNGKFQETLTEVAELLGTSYRHLLRTMEQLCDQNILKKEKSGYYITDMKKLREQGAEYYMPYESGYTVGE